MFEQADNLQEVFGAVEAAEAAEVVGFAGPAGVEGLLVVAGGVS
jgi:hypothetical protein